MKEGRFYSEEEKDYYVAQAVYENNEIIFNLIKEHIQSLITERLLAFIDVQNNPKSQLQELQEVKKEELQ